MIKLPFLSKNICKFFPLPLSSKICAVPFGFALGETRKIFSIISLRYRIIRTRCSIFCYLVDMNIYTWNILVCNSGQYIYVMGWCNFLFVLQDLIDRINSYFQRIAFQRSLLLIGSYQPMSPYVFPDENKQPYGTKLPVSIKYQNLHSFKEEVIILRQSIFEIRTSHLHGSALNR